MIRSAARKLSSARPCLGVSYPMPSPSVKAAIPRAATTPPVVARPCTRVSRLSSFHKTTPFGSCSASLHIHVKAVIGDTAAARDRGGTLADQAAVHASPLVVRRVGGLYQLSRE